jgi:hypothetical protein
VWPTISPKAGYEMKPYRELRERFVKAVETSDVCISIDFSFCSSHLNEIFKEFLDKKLLIVISPTTPIDVYGNLLKEEVPEKILSNFRAGEQLSEIVQTSHRFH